MARRGGVVEPAVPEIHERNVPPETINVLNNVYPSDARQHYVRKDERHEVSQRDESSQQHGRHNRYELLFQLLDPLDVRDLLMKLLVVRKVVRLDVP